MKKRILSACLIILFILLLVVGIFKMSGHDIKTLWVQVFGESQEGILDKDGNLVPVKQDTKLKIKDLSKAYDIILEKGNRAFYKGYPIDYSFLHWLNKAYGEGVVMDIAYRLYEGYLNEDLWYIETGSTMHVLWLEYCKELQFSTYYLENVHWVDCEDEDVVQIDFTGDINFADDWYTMDALENRENGIYDCISEDVRKELQSADVSVINNEFVFSDRGTPIPEKSYTFRANTKNVELLDVFGADIANLANNHVYDYADVGLLDTKKTLEDHGIVTMGAGKNLEEASVIQYVVANGKKIAFVSATQIEKYYNFTKEATETEAGVLKTLDPTIFNEIIRKADANSDYVLVNAHWGTEGKYFYDGSQYILAQEFVRAGADIVIGGHPHRVQGIEYIDNVPIVFSLGNFWFSTGKLYSTIAQVEIGKDGELSLRMIPCMQDNLTTYMLEGDAAADFYKFIADLSTNIVIDKDGYFYNTKDGANRDLIDGVNIYSGKGYGTHDGSVDLSGRPIDIVGNLQ